jgi:hypothetical protein
MTRNSYIFRIFALSIFFIWNIASFVSTESVKAKWITWSWCSFIGPWTNVRWNQVFASWSCLIDDVGIVYFWSWLTIGWGFWSNTDVNALQSDKYGPIWFCTFTSCSWTWWSTTYSCWTINCPAFWTSALLRKWDKGEQGLSITGATGGTGATGPTGATGATGASIVWPQWNDGYSAYELAQIAWYSGSLTDWLFSLKWERGWTWADGSLIMSGTTNVYFSWGLSGMIPQGEFDSWSVYVPITVDNNWTKYVNTRGLSNVIVWLVLFIWSMILLFRYFKKESKLQ